MSYTIDIEDTEFMGAVKARYAVIDIDDYDSGGESVTANDVGLNRFQNVDAYVRGESDYVARYDEVNRVLKILGAADTDTGDADGGELSEADAGTDVSVRFVGYGK